MTYFHPSTDTQHEQALEHGFLSMKSLLAMEKGYYKPWIPPSDRNDDSCRTLVCASYEAAVEYGSAYYGPGIDLKIIEIEGEYDSYPISGTLVPEGTKFLLGEIKPENVRLSEPAVAPASPSPRI